MSEDVLTAADGLLQFAADLEDISENNPGALGSDEHDVLLSAADVFRGVVRYFNQLDAILGEAGSHKMWAELQSMKAEHE